MKYTFLLLALTITLAFHANAQEIIKQMPAEFDTAQSNILHGKIDTITYKSKTVGNNRSALIYTPPGYSKKNKYPVLYLLHGIGGDEKEW